MKNADLVQDALTADVTWARFDTPSPHFLLGVFVKMLDAPS